MSIKVFFEKTLAWYRYTRKAKQLLVPRIHCLEKCWEGTGTESSAKEMTSGHIIYPSQRLFNGFSVLDLLHFWRDEAVTVYSFLLCFYWSFCANPLDNHQCPHCIFLVHFQLSYSFPEFRILLLVIYLSFFCKIVLTIPCLRFHI